MIAVDLIESNNYGHAQVETLKRASTIIEKVINSPSFKTAVIGYKTAGKLTFSFKKNLFKHFDSYTNEEVYQTIMQAEELEANVTNGTIDLYLTLLPTLLPGGNGTTIGYGNPGHKEIFTYAGFFDTATDARIANHLIHEWCHKIGFDHAFYAWQDRHRDRSVPYGVGDLIESLSATV